MLLQYQNGTNGKALLYGIVKTTMSRLQCVQNCADKLIRGTRKSDQVPPLLIELHWLPMSYRPILKILLTVFKIFQGRTPEYLTEWISIYNPASFLRSNGSKILNVPALIRRVRAMEPLALQIPNY